MGKCPPHRRGEAVRRNAAGDKDIQCDIPCTLPVCQVQVLLPIKINYSCQLLVQSKEPREKIPLCFHLVRGVQQCPGAFGSYRPGNNDCCCTGACRALWGVEGKLSQWAEEKMNSWDIVWPGLGTRNCPTHTRAQRGGATSTAQQH